MAAHTVRYLHDSAYGKLEHGIVIQKERDIYSNIGNRTANQVSPGVTLTLGLSDAGTQVLYALRYEYVCGWVLGRASIFQMHCTRMSSQLYRDHTGNAITHTGTRTYFCGGLTELPFDVQDGFDQ